MANLLLAMIYVSFISLGLPDSVLGSAWPSMYGQLNVPISFAGVVSMIIALGTIASSLMSDRLTRRLGAGRVTALSVAITAGALLGFSFSGSFAAVCLWAVPYGLGAGSVDACLNNYVAIHYKSRHMSWLHCMWGVGATLGPYIMGRALTGGGGWHDGYRYIGILQIGLTAALLASLPLWKRCGSGQSGQAAGDAGELSLAGICAIPGTKQAMLCFFAYCGVEQTAGLWASSYLMLHRGVAPETAAGFASLFFMGITVGRAISGFAAMRLGDAQMVRAGQGIILAGILSMLLPLPEPFALAGLVLIGLGCAPVYPSLIHSTPRRFGAERSQAVIGVQMASAYAGTCLLPPLFGVIASRVSITLLPAFLLAGLIAMALAHESLERRAPAG